MICPFVIWSRKYAKNWKKKFKKYVGKEKVKQKGKNGKVKVTKNSLVLDEDSLEYMMETIAEELQEDDEFLKSAGL